MKYVSIIIFFCSMIMCHPLKRSSNITPQGDEAIIHLEGGINLQGELITVFDSILYIMNQDKITPISLAEIRKIEIPGYNVEAGQAIAAALPSLVMQSIILGVASNVGEKTWVTIAGISMTITVFLYASASTTRKIKAPLLEDDIEQLRLYCRFPQELDTRVWEVILNQLE